MYLVQEVVTRKFKEIEKSKNGSISSPHMHVPFLESLKGEWVGLYLYLYVTQKLTQTQNISLHILSLQQVVEKDCNIHFSLWLSGSLCSQIIAPNFTTLQSRVSFRKSFNFSLNFKFFFFLGRGLALALSAILLIQGLVNSVDNSISNSCLIQVVVIFSFKSEILGLC